MLIILQSPSRKFYHNMSNIFETKKQHEISVGSLLFTDRRKDRLRHTKKLMQMYNPSSVGDNNYFHSQLRIQNSPQFITARNITWNEKSSDRAERHEIKLSQLQKWENKGNILNGGERKTAKQCIKQRTNILYASCEFFNGTFKFLCAF